MDPIEEVKRLREEYERAIDTAESRRAAYHDAILELHAAGVPLREIAAQLGLSHQRVHQIVTSSVPRRRKAGKAAARVAAAALLAIAATLGGLRLAHAAPFESSTALSGPVLEQIVAEARTELAGLGDPSVSTAEVFGPGRETVLERAMSGDPPPRRSSLWGSGGYYLIVLRGSFTCGYCSRAGGGPPFRGVTDTIVWSPAHPDSPVAHGLSTGPLPSLVWRLPGPLTIGLA